MPSERVLVVNADDLGLSDGVNRGVFEAHERGVVTSASLMVRRPAAGAAALGALEREGLAVGLHVDLGEWCFRNGTWETSVWVVDCDDVDAVAAEVGRQLESFRALMGRDPAHMDSHQHVHRQPPVAGVLAGVAAELGVRLRDHGPVAYCGAFYGQLSHGEPYAEGITVANLVRIIEGLPPGVTELGCHPGYVDAGESSYAAERLTELRTLCDPAVADALRRAGVRLSSVASLTSS